MSRWACNQRSAPDGRHRHRRRCGCRHSSGTCCPPSCFLVSTIDRCRAVLDDLAVFSLPLTILVALLFPIQLASCSSRHVRDETSRFRTDPGSGVTGGGVTAATATHAHTLLVDNEMTLTDWCRHDSGPATIIGSDVSAYVSVTRDGSVWLRLGAGGGGGHFDWQMVNRRRPRVQTPVIDDEALNIIKSVPFHEYCVLTDVELRLTVQAGWNPSYLTFYDPQQAETRIVSLKKPGRRECSINTTLSLSADKQGLFCDGGRRSSCGQRNAPDHGKTTPPWLLKYVSLDLDGPDRFYCPSWSPLTSTSAYLDDDPDDTDDYGQRKPISAGIPTSAGRGATDHGRWGDWQGARRPPMNSFTFVGSYYHVYVKLASCTAPTDSRSLGNEIRLRSRQDVEANRIVIADPSQTVMQAGLIEAWAVFITAVSPFQHSLYLQVWRPVPLKSTSSNLRSSVADKDMDSRPPVFYYTLVGQPVFLYTLVGQTLFKPQELRFHQFRLPRAERIAVEPGDVLGLYHPELNPIGLYHPELNPIGWTSVPCVLGEDGTGIRHRRRLLDSPARLPSDGDTFEFTAAPLTGDGPCRQYSFGALFANKSFAKTVEDWTCPSGLPSSTTSSYRHGVSARQPLSTFSSSPADVQARVFDSSRMLQNQRAIDDARKWKASSSSTSFRNRGGESGRRQVANELSAHDSVPVHFILLVIAVLLLALTLVGIASYCQAVRG